MANSTEAEEAEEEEDDPSPAKEVAPAAAPRKVGGPASREASFVSYGHISGLFAQEVDIALAGSVKPRRVFNTLRVKHKPPPGALPEHLQKFMLIPSAKQIRERGQTLTRRSRREANAQKTRSGVKPDAPGSDDEDPPPGTTSSINAPMTVS